ncbi:MAG TPA: hypothetical protein VMW38_11470 [Terriglobia bacterium]|nr:hypothetical protein [Terriglobia bacterium]
MSDYLKGILAIALATTTGYLLLRAIDPQRSLKPAGNLAISYGLGIGAVTWLMQILSFAGIKFTPLSLLVSICVVGLSLTFFGLRQGLERPRPNPSSLADDLLERRRTPGDTWAERVLSVLIALEVILTVSLSLLTPIEAYDAVAIWGLKAKATFMAQGIPTEFLLDSSYRNYAYHPDYPQLVPLAQSYCCFLSDHFNEYVAKLIFPCFWLGCLIFMGGAGERLGLCKKERLGLMFLLGSVPFYSSQTIIGYADEILAFYFAAGAIYLYWWVRDMRVGDLILSSLLLGFAGMTKNEGLALGLICWLIMIVLTIRDSRSTTVKSRWMLCGLYFLIQLAVQLPWLAFRVYFHLSNDVVNKDALWASLHWSTLKRLVPIFYAYQTQIWGLRNWNLVWIALLVVLVLRGKSIVKTDSIYLLLPILMCLLVYTSIYLITPRDVVWHLKTSVSRVYLHFLPLTVFFLARVYAGLKYRET